MNHNNDGIIATVICVFAFTLAFILIFVVSDLEFQVGEESIKAKTFFWSDKEVFYSDIDYIELRENLDKGSRVTGYGSVKLQLGLFSNGEFGSYHLYCHNAGSEIVVIHLLDGSVVAIGGKNNEETEKLYAKILQET